MNNISWHLAKNGSDSWSSVSEAEAKELLDNSDVGDRMLERMKDQRNCMVRVYGGVLRIESQ